MRAFAAARAATSWLWLLCARTSACWCTVTAFLKPITSFMTATSCVETDCTVSTRLTRSSMLVAPRMHAERRLVVARRVDRDETLHERPLRLHEVRARGVQPDLVDLQVVLDLLRASRSPTRSGCARARDSRRVAGSAPRRAAPRRASPLTEGSPVAVPAATKAAATARTSTGACRFRTLITDSRTSLATSAPGGAGTSQVRRLAGVPDACNRANVRKTCCNSASILHKTCARAGPHKVGEVQRFVWYGPAPVGRPRTRSAARLAGAAAALVLAGVSAAGAAGPGRFAPATAGAVARRACASRVARSVCTRFTPACGAGAPRVARAADGRLRHAQAQLVQQLGATRRTLAVSQHETRRQSVDALQAGRRQRARGRARLAVARRRGDAARRPEPRRRSEPRGRRRHRRCADLASTRLRATLDAKRRALDAAVAARAQRRTRSPPHARSGVGFIATLRARAEPEGRADPRARGDGAAGRPQVRRAPAAAAAAGDSTLAAGTRSRRPVAPAPAGHDAHRLLDRLLAPGAHGDRAARRLGRRRGRPGRDPARDAPDDPRLRRGRGRRHRERRPGSTIDLWFPTLAQARAWGRRTVTITLH